VQHAAAVVRTGGELGLVQLEDSGDPAQDAGGVNPSALGVPVPQSVDERTWPLLGPVPGRCTIYRARNPSRATFDAPWPTQTHAETGAAALDGPLTR
jgi:hypothetical protein